MPVSCTLWEEYNKKVSTGLRIWPQRGISLIVIADAIACKHDWCRQAAPISMISKKKAHAGIAPLGTAKTRQKVSLKKEMQSKSSQRGYRHGE